MTKAMPRNNAGNTEAHSGGRKIPLVLSISSVSLSGHLIYSHLTLFQEGLSIKCTHNKIKK